MSATNDGGPAFPRPSTVKPANSEHWTDSQPGMSLRDYLAAKALAGFIANPTIAQSDSDDLMAMPSICYRLADAMLAERAKGGQQ